MIPPDEVGITAIWAQGAGGQNVNKLLNAMPLRFDIAASSLPEAIRGRVGRGAGRCGSRRAAVSDKESGPVEQLSTFGHQCAGEVGIVVGVEGFHHLVRRL